MPFLTGYFLVKRWHLNVRVISLWWSNVVFDFGFTNRHFATRIREHLSFDKHSHIKHLEGSENCLSLCPEDCFLKSRLILDSASTSFQLKIKEVIHILWEQPSLNFQVRHLNSSLSNLLVSFLSLNSCLFAFLFSSSSLIIVVNISLCYTTYCTISFYFSLYNWHTAICK